MTEETVHIRWGYAMDGDRRLNYWEAVQEREGGETVVARTPMILEPQEPPYSKFLMTERSEQRGAHAFEHEVKMRGERRKLVEQLMADGWVVLERDEEGMVITMRRGTK